LTNFFQKYNLDEREIVEVDSLPLNPTKYIYIYFSDFENTTSMNYHYQDNRYAKNKQVYINEEGELKLVALTYDMVFVRLLLFLKKYRKSPELLPNILDNFNMSDDEKEIKLKRMQLMLRPMKTLEEFRKALQLANKNLPWHKDLSCYGDRLMFVNKEEDLGKIINVFGKKSLSAEKLLKKYNDLQWERGILYNEEENRYEDWFVPERSNDWSVYAKFDKKEYLFEYLLNYEIQAVGYGGE